jgi:hypothetical protein
VHFPNLFWFSLNDQPLLCLAYLGGIGGLSTPSLISTGGSILSTEARQAAWLNSAVLKAQPWSGSFDVTLTPSVIFSVVAGFVDQCPKDNPPSIASVFTPFSLSDAKPGKKVTFGSSQVSYTRTNEVTVGIVHRTHHPRGWRHRRKDSQ